MRVMIWFDCALMAASLANLTASRISVSLVDRSWSSVMSASCCVRLSSSTLRLAPFSLMSPSPEICCSYPISQYIALERKGGEIVEEVDYSPSQKAPDYSLPTYHLFRLKALQDLVEAVIQSDDPNSLWFALTYAVNSTKNLHNLVNIVGDAHNDNIGAHMVEIEARVG